MASVSWEESSSVWIASLDGVPVCTLRSKDIGGCIAMWQGDRLWPAPAHLPKALPQPTRFFADAEEAKSAVEQQLLQP
jgi:hypothetical protein